MGRKNKPNRKYNSNLFKSKISRALKSFFDALNLRIIQLIKKRSGE